MTGNTDSNHRDTSPWMSRSPSAGPSSRVNARARQPDTEHAPDPSASHDMEDNRAANNHAATPRQERTSPTSIDEVQFIRSETWSMNPPPRPGPGAASSVSDDAHDLRDESPLFLSDSRQSTREPSAAPQPQPQPQQPPARQSRLHRQSPLSAESRQQSVDPQARAQTQTSSPFFAQATALPSTGPLQPRPSNMQRSVRSESPLFVESRECTLEPQAQPQPQERVTPFSLAAALLPASATYRSNSPSPAPEPRGREAPFVQSRDTTVAPQPAPDPDLQPQAQAAPVPVAEDAPVPSPTPQYEQASASPAVSEANDATPGRMSSEELLVAALTSALEVNPANYGANQQPVPDETSQSTPEAGAAAKKDRLNKRRNTADDHLDASPAAGASGGAQPRGGGKKHKAGGDQTRKRKRESERAGTPMPQPEGRQTGEGSGRRAGVSPGSQDESSAPGNAGFVMDHQKWMQQAKRATLGLRGKERKAGEGARSPGGRKDDAAGSPGAPGIGPGGLGGWRSHGVTVVTNAQDLEMPTRDDFIYGYGRLRAKHFRWGPKEEKASTGGRTPTVAPYPWVGDPAADDADQPSEPRKPPRKKKMMTRKKGAKTGTDKRAPTASKSSSPAVPEKREPPTLLSLPPEVRENIWRQLLVADKAILVHRKWTMVCRVLRPRNGGKEDPTRLNLHLAVLRTCKLFSLEAFGVLYGENTFRYRMRDSLSAPVVDDGGAEGDDDDDDDDNDDGGDQDEQVPETDGDDYDGDGEYVDEDEEAGRKRRSGDNGKAGTDSNERLINIERHYHLIRHLAVEIEQNRTGRNVMASVAEAIKVFSDRVQPPDAQGRHHHRQPRQPNIRTLKLIIHPTLQDDNHVSFTFTDFFEARSPVVAAMRALRSQFLYIDVMSVFLNRHEKNRRLVVDLRPQRAFLQLEGRGRGLAGAAHGACVDRVMRTSLCSSIQTCDRVMGQLDKHVKACCEVYAANQAPLHSPYCWFVDDLEEDEYDYLF